MGLFSKKTKEIPADQREWRDVRVPACKHSYDYGCDCLRYDAFMADRPELQPSRRGATKRTFVWVDPIDADSVRLSTLDGVELGWANIPEEEQDWLGSRTYRFRYQAALSVARIDEPDDDEPEFDEFISLNPKGSVEVFTPGDPRRLQQ